MRKLTIKKADYGYIVKFGNTVICVEHREDLIIFLNEYIKNPEQVKSDWIYDKKLPFTPVG